jgi:hypothetical protein
MCLQNNNQTCQNTSADYLLYGQETICGYIFVGILCVRTFALDNSNVLRETLSQEQKSLMILCQPFSVRISATINKCGQSSPSCPPW